ncbi:aspartate/glutamate racemase family protein [Paracoccus sp. (in: a-proteobacteria)]|uniref:aspartate/glutamate racemase family protein n=1 Tax=Paracoccus sp. TaxID=267 RepID=UPI003A846BB1
MRIFWQSFVDRDIGADYLKRLTGYLNGIAAEGTEVVVEGMSPPDRDFGRLAEFRCAAQAIRRALQIPPGTCDAYVMGHFQDPGLYELRSVLDIPVIGTGEATMLAGSTLGRRMGIVTLSPEFTLWHHEQADRYGMGHRLVGVETVESDPQEFNASFAGDTGARKALLDRLHGAADRLVGAGADVILTGGVLPGLFVAEFPGMTVGHAPVVNCASVALKSAEMWAQLRKIDQLGPSRGPSFATPRGQAQQDFHNIFSTPDNGV